jgi:hypothetical protein
MKRFNPDNADIVLPLRILGDPPEAEIRRDGQKFIY